MTLKKGLLAGASLPMPISPYTLRRKKTVLIVVGVLMIAGGVACGVLWISQATNEQATPAAPETIRLAAEAGLLASSVWVAEQNGYFTEEGLDVRIREYGSGRAAFRGLLEEEGLDIATSAQTPVVAESFSRRDFAVIAAMVSSQNDTKILARKDRNIRSPADLQGKRIGVTKNSTGHYFLGLFLAQHGLGLDDVTVTDIAAPDLAAAAIQGDVDAISSWEPHIYNAKKTLAGNAMVFESDGTFREDFYFVAFRDWARQHAGTLQKFLRAIDKANAFMATHPAGSQEIVAKRLQIDPGMVAAVWSDFDFGLFLDQAVLLAFEQQARWIIRNGNAENVKLPNYLEFIWLDALDAVLPGSISIIR